MIIGDPATFAIESQIYEVLKSESQLGLGCVHSFSHFCFQGVPVLPGVGGLRDILWLEGGPRGRSP